jgi:putative RecB family exonuclease
VLYRYRVIDRLPEPPSLEAARGSVVHGILEQLFELPAAGRTLAAAVGLVGPQWEQALADDPELAALVDADAGGLLALLESTQDLLGAYFTLEDPRRLEPADREVLVETTLPSGIKLKGFVDRLDRAADGQVRVVDYKTGKSPREEFEGKALFQLRFYALVLWRSTGVVPSLLRLYYLADREILDRTRRTSPAWNGSYRHSARPSARRGGPATGGTSRASSATGARSTRCVRLLVAPRHPCPTRCRSQRNPARSAHLSANVPARG